MARKFSSSRLFILTKKLVIVLTILLAAFTLMVGYSNFNTYGDNWNNRTQNQCRENYQELITEKKIFPTQQELDRLVGDCYLNKVKYRSEDFNVFNRSLTITILLPFTFFIGTRLFNYLFPEQTKISKSIKKKN